MKKTLVVFGFVLASVFLGFYLQYRKEVLIDPDPSPFIEISLIDPDLFVEIDPRPEKIDRYFRERNLPLADLASFFVVAADSFGLDYRLLPAIGMRESSGGKFACGNNPFGWDSCAGRDFKSFEDAITYISWRLSESPYYAGKTTYQKLRTYNSIIGRYPEQVIDIMNTIDPL